MSYNSLEDTGDAGIDERTLKRRGDDSWRKMEGLPNGNGDNDNVGEHEEEPLNTRQRSSNRRAAAIGLRRVFPSHAETNFLSGATVRVVPTIDDLPSTVHPMRCIVPCIVGTTLAVVLGRDRAATGTSTHRHAMSVPTLRSSWGGVALQLVQAPIATQRACPPYGRPGRVSPLNQP